MDYSPSFCCSSSFHNVMAIFYGTFCRAKNLEGPGPKKTLRKEAIMMIGFAVLIRSRKRSAFVVVHALATISTPMGKA